MKYFLYSLFDKKAMFYSKPFTAQNDDVAIRLINNSMKNKSMSDTEFVTNPEDFSLFKTGSFDDASNIVESDNKFMCELASLKE